MIKQLRSTRLTWYTLVVLIFFLVWGVVLATIHKPVFNSLNHTDLTQWLSFAHQKAPLTVFWFTGICLTACVLLVNGICCGLTRLLMPAIKTRAPRQWLFLIIHILFLVVLGCHGLTLIMTQKHSQVTLYADQSIEIMDRTIQVQTIHYGDDPAILTAPKQQQRKMMTSDHMDMSHNWARLTVSQKKHPEATPTLYILSPYRDRFFQATITQFTFDPDRNAPGITLNFTKNYFNLFFFSVYAVMILTLAGFTVVTWKTPHKGDQK